MKYINIQSIEELEEPEDVYDIEVENSHTFFADGMCVHNCMGGTFAKIIFDELRDKHENLIDLNPDTPHDFENLQRKLKEYSERFVEVLGEGNYFLELQWNRLPVQSLINLHILECSKRTGIPVVTTADSHYSNPSHWKEREIYKAMAWSSKTKGTIDINTLPQKIEELKCELYPKNADQMWESYLRYSEPYKKHFEPFNEQICNAIELTHDIAHQMIGDLQIDKSIKLPTLSQISDLPVDRLKKLIDAKGGDEDKAAFSELVRIAIDGLIWRGKDKDPVYVKRLEKELDITKKLNFSKYFLTYHKIMKIIGSEMLTGAGRGSAGGSLLAYCLDITQIDPIKLNLIVERFITPKKAGMCDVDCLASNTKIIMHDGSKKELSKVCVGDQVLDKTGIARKVTYVQHRQSNENDELFCIFVNIKGTFGTILANHKHRLLLDDSSFEFVSNIIKGDWLLSLSGPAFVLDKVKVSSIINLTDITVEESATFNVVPFNVFSCKDNISNTKSLVGINSYSIDADEYKSRSTSCRIRM